MSLIEEALRKHREEQAAQEPTAPPQGDSASTPTNPPDLPATREPSHRRMLLVVGLNLLLVVGVLAVIVWGSWRLLKRAGWLPAASPIGSGSVVALSGTTATITIATATTSPKSTSDAVAATNREPALPAATLINGLVTGVTAAAATSTFTGITVATAASTSQPSAQVTAVPLPLPAQPRPVWPRLAVSGIMEAPGNRSTAIVNGKLLRQGETAQGVTITAITKQGVTFEFKGESRRIRTGYAAE